MLYIRSDHVMHVYTYLLSNKSYLRSRKKEGERGTDGERVRERKRGIERERKRQRVRERKRGREIEREREREGERG